ncbi:MAG: hypothetical protein A2Y94_03925 [Caldithrix sp. RBG_13_44_9]|nr:MAG: hypothetical protein A2Y94_03925 [Caldithrix sp. RBG_13_44_9]
MRTKGIIFLLVLFGIIIGLMMLFTDRWLEGQMESIGSSLVGARVEFDGVDFSFIRLHMKWKRLQVTNADNTWRNLFETAAAEFDLDLLPLFSKKVIIENLQLEGLRFNTERLTDGKIEKKKEEPARKSEVMLAIEDKLKAETAQMPVFNLQKYTKKVNVDSLWKLVNLQTPQKIDSLKGIYQQKYSEWQNKISELPSEKELQQVTQQIQSIKVDQIKSPEEFKFAYDQANQIYRQVDSSYKSITSLKSDFDIDLAQVVESQKSVTGWIKQDYQRALNLAQIPDISVSNVAKILFGDRVVQMVQRVLGYVGTARYYSEKMKSTKPEKESPPRLRGQDIHFSATRELPKFWIKQISLSGEAWNEMQITGKVENIVSQQTLIDKPTTIDISGTRRDQAALKLFTTLDYRQEVPQEKIELSLQNMPLSNVKLTNFALLPQKIQQGTGKLSALLNFTGRDFESNIQFAATDLKFDYSDKPTNLDARLVELSRSITESLTLITMDAQAAQAMDKFKFRINSNLDELIASRFKGILSAEIEKAKQQIEGRVRQEVEKYQKELEMLVAQKEQELRSQIQKVENEVKKQEEMIKQKQKEIENQIAAEKNKLQQKLQDEGKNKLKDLFKK